MYPERDSQTERDSERALYDTLAPSPRLSPPPRLSTLFLLAPYSWIKVLDFWMDNLELEVPPSWISELLTQGRVLSTSRLDGGAGGGPACAYPSSGQ